MNNTLTAVIAFCLPTCTACLWWTALTLQQILNLLKDHIK